MTFIQMLFMGIDYFNYYDVYKTVTYEGNGKTIQTAFRRENAALSVIKPL